MILTSVRLFVNRCRNRLNVETYRFGSVPSSTIELNSTINQLISSGRHDEALRLFNSQPTLKDNRTIVLILKAATKLFDQETGIRIHQQLTSESLQNSRIQTSLIEFYMRFHRVADAVQIFSTAKKKTEFMFDAMLKGYLSNNMPEKVIELYETTQVEANETMTTTLFNACAQLGNIRAITIARQVLDQVPKPFLQHRLLISAAISMLLTFGDVQGAERLFEQVESKTIVTYGAMMQNYIKSNRLVEALNFAEQVPLPLNEVLHILVFKACALLCDERAKALGRRIFQQMPATFLDDIVVVNSAIHMFMRFGEVQQAESLFRQAKNKSTASYGVLMQGYLTNNQYSTALDLLEQIPGKLDKILHVIAFNVCATLHDERAMTSGSKLLDQMPRTIWNHTPAINAAMHMCMNFGQVTEAESMFKQIRQPTTRTYGVMLNGYKINERPEECLSLFEEAKKKGVTVNAPIALALVGACAQLGMRSISERIVQQIAHVKRDLPLHNSLINLWGKSGHVNRALKTFQSIGQPDVISHNCMINAYGRNGMGYEAIDVYERTPKNVRTPISHVCVLNACSHSGLINQARSIFENVGKRTEHIITTMVDCLSRLALFEEAEKLISNYEETNPPCLVMYMALLSAARNHRRVLLSEQLYNRMQRLFPDRRDNLIAASVLVCNTLASAGDELKAREVRLNRIKRFGKNVKVGTSWTEFNGQLVRFHAHDRSHPRSAEIYDQVNEMSTKLKEHGHEYDSAWVTRPLNNNESVESMLCGHSEKLAIAFNLMQRPQPTFIQITKNLRVCGDCHRATKLIAKIYQCQIIVRDVNRFHYISPDGQCSCHDHF